MIYSSYKNNTHLQNVHMIRINCFWLNMTIDTLSNEHMASTVDEI